MDLDTVVDCACSRTLAGVAWCKKYLEVLKKFGIPYIVIEQEEHFKFGGPLSLSFYEGNCGVASHCWAMVHDQDFHRLSSGTTPS